MAPIRRTMIHTFKQWLLTAAAIAGRRLVQLVYEMAPTLFFFFIALMLILVLFKLFVARYSFEFYAFSKAAIGALILGKVVLLMEWLESGRRANDYPRAVAVAGKTIIYGFMVLIFGTGEQFVHACRETGGFRGALDLLIARADLNRFLGFVLLISITVGSYLAIQEIDRAMGKGALFRLFFNRPVAAHAAASKALESQ